MLFQRISRMMYNFSVFNKRISIKISKFDIKLSRKCYMSQIEFQVNQRRFMWINNFMTTNTTVENWIISRRDYFPKGLWRDIETTKIRSLSSIDGVATNGGVPGLADSENQCRFRLADNCQPDEIRLKLNRWLWKQWHIKFPRKVRTLLDTLKHVEVNAANVTLRNIHTSRLDFRLLRCLPKA